MWSSLSHKHANVIRKNESTPVLMKMLQKDKGQIKITKASKLAPSPYDIPPPPADPTESVVSAKKKTTSSSQKKTSKTETKISGVFSEGNKTKQVKMTER